MEISGKIIAVMPAQSGISQKTGKQWMSQEYVLETVERYVRHMVFSVFGEDKIRTFNLQVGQYVTVSFDVDAHESKGRWYNSLQAWKVTYQPTTSPMQQPVQTPQATPQNAALVNNPQVQQIAQQLGASPVGNNDLPF